VVFCRRLSRFGLNAPSRGAFNRKVNLHVHSHANLKFVFDPKKQFSRHTESDNATTYWVLLNTDYSMSERSTHFGIPMDLFSTVLEDHRQILVRAVDARRCVLAFLHLLSDS
jgi:hypothetical protein